MKKPRGAGDSSGAATRRNGGRPFVDPEHVRRADTADAFMPDPEDGPAVINDDLAENLAEEFLQAATSGEDVGDEASDGMVAEEIGGPFVETTAAEEFAPGTDASNPDDATAEPMPLAVSGLAQGPRSG